MIVKFRKQFLKDIKNIKSPTVKKSIQQSIILLERSTDLRSINNLKKLKGYDDFYRIRLGEYRLGISLENEVIWVERFLHRKDIYKKFP